MRDGSSSLEEESITQVSRSLWASLHTHLALIVMM